jgi:beta-galactosidase
MKRSAVILLFWSIFIFLPNLSLFSRDAALFNTNWKFNKGNPEGAELPDFDDSAWEKIRLPHDWAIAEPFDALGDPNTGKLPWKGEGWYRKTFSLDEAFRDRRVYFIFDGIMAFPKVYINGQLAGSWDYGYNSFYLDVTDLVKAGASNVMAIYVDTRQHDSRWYPGAGIYRKIQMLVVDPVHVGIWDTFVSTPEVNDTWADVRVQSNVLNTSNRDERVLVEYRIISPQGKVISSDTLSKIIPAGAQAVFEKWFTLTRPQRWDIDNPARYRVKTIVGKPGKIWDVTETPFGIRTFKFTANDGFYLNERKVALKGVNLHHDHGPLGAKFYRRAMERQLEIMKEMGCNAVRNSHNVAAPEFLELCDSMGLLVFNEAYDKWDRKAGILPGADFYETGERNIRNFVKRDRNHPSVILWSVGNEMRDVQNNSDDGLLKLQAMLDYVRRFDPTRPLTIANDIMPGVKWRHFDYYDVHSWNYGRRYLPAREAEPNKAVIISESASTVSSRGFYEFPFPEKKTDFTTSLQISSYDVHAPWWAEIPDDDFAWQERDRYVCGEFVWTGFDYLGEPTPYDNFLVEQGKITREQTAKSSFFGIVDLVGIPKDRFYLYKSYWKPEENTVHLLPHWNWSGKEGRDIPVVVYTNGDCAELFLNGESMGKRCKEPKAENTMKRYRLIWDAVPYRPGELKAVAYKEGVAIGEAVVKTAGKPARLRLTADRMNLVADGEDLTYITVEALDAEGNLCPLADHQVSFSVVGPAYIEGVGNGDPHSLEPFQSNRRKLFHGKAVLVIRTDETKAGKIEITASSPELGYYGIFLESRKD